MPSQSLQRRSEASCHQSRSDTSDIMHERHWIKTQEARTRIHMDQTNTALAHTFLCVRPLVNTFLAASLPRNASTVPHGHAWRGEPLEHTAPRGHAWSQVVPQVVFTATRGSISLGKLVRSPVATFVTQSVPLEGGFGREQILWHGPSSRSQGGLARCHHSCRCGHCLRCSTQSAARLATSALQPPPIQPWAIPRCRVPRCKTDPISPIGQLSANWTADITRLVDEWTPDGPLLDP
jgi:hypothetical protein